MLSGRPAASINQTQLKYKHQNLGCSL
uniref:Uncharacterized protein n=1 Tax=Rhizophora mucronata TaxID=61149 RepID=A0A2P2INH2_RHIMU